MEGLWYTNEGTYGESPINGIKLSFKQDTLLITKKLNAQGLSYMHRATVTFSHDGRKYKVDKDGKLTSRKKKKGKGKPETKDKLYRRIIGLTKKLKDWEK